MWKSDKEVGPSQKKRSQGEEQRSDEKRRGRRRQKENRTKYNLMDKVRLDGIVEVIIRQVTMGKANVKQKFSNLCI